MADTSGLFTALLAVQKAAPTLPKDKTAKVKMKNGGEYQYRYTDLATVVATVAPLLSEHGLVWTSFPAHHEGTPVLRYKIAHAESGESLEDEMPLLLGGQIDSQGLGSALTYARRYSLCAVLNLVADEDDDGRAANTYGSNPRSKPAATKPPKSAKASRDDVQRIHAAADGLSTLQLLNLLRSVYNAKPLELSEQDAIARLEAGMVNLAADKVPVVLAKIAEAKSA
jgi:hypothetical protein